MSDKTFSVKMPFCGYIEIVVEAATEEAAKQKFYEEYDKTDGLHNAMQLHHGEWDFLEEILKGNVFYGVLNRMEITEEL
jgi:hypothetical protein